MSLHRLPLVCLACSLLTATAFAQNPPHPFGNSTTSLPVPYSGPVFHLSYAYPSAPPTPPASRPWQQAIGNGTINTTNAAAYVAALKNYILTTEGMAEIITNYGTWNAGAAGWYNEPWLASMREPTHGLYLGSSGFQANLFPGTGLTAPFDTYVLTLYDPTAAATLYNVWGTTGLTPTINATSSQFAEGGVVVKLAFTTANANVWPAMTGAAQWNIVFNGNTTTNPSLNGQLAPASFFQFDLIVKDTQSSPQTGWVFATLVYDQSAPGNSIWDKMVPLGAMWGNDPGVNSSQLNPPPLAETWINPSAPAYSKMTLGWGGRLSGPNDGALNDLAFATGQNQITTQANAPSSSCMSCHGTAQWPMQSFLLPSVANLSGDPGSFYFPAAIDSTANNGNGWSLSWTAGSSQWNRWFQSRAGNVPQDAGNTAFDYDMVFAFKSLPQWQAWQQASGGSGVNASTAGLTAAKAGGAEGRSKLAAPAPGFLVRGAHRTIVIPAPAKR